MQRVSSQKDINGMRGYALREEKANCKWMTMSEVAHPKWIQKHSKCMKNSRENSRIRMKGRFDDSKERWKKSYATTVSDFVIVVVKLMNKEIR